MPPTRAQPIRAKQGHRRGDLQEKRVELMRDWAEPIG
jgi:hypothetical protein